ncbi:MAG TPA: peptide deformylase [bacterium]|nr:peptide deformylase [bacterium]
MRDTRTLEIVTVDGPRAGILRRRARQVGRVTLGDQHLIDAMLETLHTVRGLGLAAPQVGESKRILVAEVEDRVVVLVDPTISRASGEEIDTEACLSIPGVVAPVRRALRVTVKGKNRRGRGITVQAEGLLARVLQHEIDHLDGILFLDRVEDPAAIERIRPEETEEVAAAGE